MWFYLIIILYQILSHLCWGVLPVFTHMGMRAGASAARVCRPCWIWSTASIALGFNKVDSCSGLCIYTVNNKDIYNQRIGRINIPTVKLPPCLIFHGSCFKRDSQSIKVDKYLKYWTWCVYHMCFSYVTAEKQKNETCCRTKGSCCLICCCSCGFPENKGWLSSIWKSQNVRAVWALKPDTVQSTIVPCRCHVMCTLLV